MFKTYKKEIHYLHLAAVFITCLCSTCYIFLVSKNIKTTRLYFCLQTTLGKAFSPIYLLAPVQIMTWLNQYHNYCEEVLSHIKYVVTDILT